MKANINFVVSLNPKEKALDKILKNNPKLKDWLDKYKDAKLQKQVAQNAAANRDQALDKFCRESNKQYAEQAATIDKTKAQLKPEDAEGKANLKKAEEQLGKLRKELERDFNNTENGKAANKEMRDTQKNSEKADAAEREAGKNIPKETKEMVGGLQDEIDAED